MSSARPASSSLIRPAIRAGVPIVAVLFALAIGAIVLGALDASPWEGYRAMLDGAFGSSDAWSATILKAAPLLLVASGICVAFRAKVINIGGEGQMIAGALVSTALAINLPDVPRVVLLPLLLIAGFAGGGAWGAIPGFLKARYEVSEILSTIMLNIVAVQMMNYLLRGPMIDPAERERGTSIPQTQRLTANTDLPNLIPGTRIHLGVLIAVVVAVAVWVLLWRTPAGFRIRAVGESRPAAKYAGIRVERSIMSSLALSGALAGLAGTMLVIGSESHRMVTDGSSTGFTGNAGFNGIVVALFGALHPIAAIPASVLFGALLVGANAMQRAVQVPSALIVALNGLVVLFVVSSDRLRNRLLSWVGGDR
ncbi:MAG: ABC transporter permease [Ilumatobacteraceae bacterium]